MPELTPESLMMLGRGFQEARILLTAVELDLFTTLATRPLTAAEAAGRINGDQRAVTILLDALTAMGLLGKSRGAYRCEPPVAARLASDGPESVRPMLLHQNGLWQRWTELTGVIRGDQEAVARARTLGDEARRRAFIGAMHVVSRPQAAQIAAAIRPGEARRLLDVGAGPGTYAIALLAVSPELRATLFDWPVVVEMARSWVAEAGMLDRVSLVGGDFYADELPPGHDLALLSAIIHQNSRQQNVDLYRKVLRALEPGGRLVIRDHVVSDDRTSPRSAAVFAINMLVGTEGGNVYTMEEIRADLAQAGFERIRLIQPGDDRMNGLVEGYRRV